MQKKGKGGFLFISHSHKDMDKVRLLRNSLEEAGYEPLCFYLKCLDDNIDELDDLIKREIDAREWFVYAISDNSRDSDWVQKECEWRTREESKNKQILKWNLESNVSVDEVSKKLIKGLRVNIIHSSDDSEFVAKLITKLREKDLQVTADMNIARKDWKKWENKIRDNIEKSSNYGANIVIFSKNSVNSYYLKRKVEVAHFRGSLIIPVFIDDVELETRMEFILCKSRSIIASTFSKKPIKDEKDLNLFVERVVNEIRHVLDMEFNNL